MASNMRSKAAWRVLATALVLELIAGAFIIVGMVPTFPGAGPDAQAFIPLWLSLFICVIAWWVWIGATLYGVMRSRRSWVRSAAFTSHILLFAAGMGVLQGILGTPPVGYALAIIAVIGFAATWFAKPVRSPETAPEV